jgi:hypothetical protein
MGTPMPQFEIDEGIKDMMIKKKGNYTTNRIERE